MTIFGKKIKGRMMTLNSILKEMKDVPDKRLEELYQIVHSLTTVSKKPSHDEALRNKILTYSGAFSDMSENEYTEFLDQTKKVRTTLFDRNNNL